mmetsp:Transcript_28597/g.71158  ORF Transcript_28597/g.71158 Transcript_28597/m.71158 type:complete len:239 (+) Transcript_28597:2968-3684(+)
MSSTTPLTRQLSDAAAASHSGRLERRDRSVGRSMKMGLAVANTRLSAAKRGEWQRSVRASRLIATMPFEPKNVAKSGGDSVTARVKPPRRRRSVAASRRRRSHASSRPLGCAREASSGWRTPAGLRERSTRAAIEQTRASHSQMTPSSKPSATTCGEAKWMCSKRRASAERSMQCWYSASVSRASASESHGSGLCALAKAMHARTAKASAPTHCPPSATSRRRSEKSVGWSTPHGRLV